MIKIEQNTPDLTLLRSFLGKVEYRKFNYWPNINEVGLVDILIDDILVTQEPELFFQATQNGKIVALLVFQNLPWDTKHYGFKCGQIKYLLTDNEADILTIQSSLERVLVSFQKYCTDSGIKFVSVDVDSWDSIKSVALQKVNFRFILAWIDGVSRDLKNYPDLPNDAEFGAIKPDEVQHFSLLSSRNYFKGGRFYVDHGFISSKVDEMYGELVKSSFDKNEIMLVYRVKGDPVGLFICKKIVTYNQFSSLRVAPLRFLIVDPQCRNRNVALNLFTQTIHYLSMCSDIVTTGLEIHNIPSINLHSKLGFRFNYTHNVFHWWNAFL